MEYWDKRELQFNQARDLSLYFDDTRPSSHPERPSDFQRAVLVYLVPSNYAYYSFIKSNGFPKIKIEGILTTQIAW